VVPLAVFGSGCARGSPSGAERRWPPDQASSRVQLSSQSLPRTYRPLRNSPVASPIWERDRGLDVQPQEPPLSIGVQLLVSVKPLAVGHVQDLGDIGKDIRVAVWALGVDPRCAKLGLIPGDVRTAEQPQMLIGNGEPLNAADHVKQHPRVSQPPAPVEAQAHAVLPAEPVKRLDLSQIFTDDHRVGGEHGIVAASGDRLAQGGQLATRLAGVGAGQPRSWTRLITMPR
jgi:hypothetical protein